MKTANKFFSLSTLALIVISIVAISCEKEGTASLTKKVYYDPTAKQEFSLENQANLNQLAKVFANEKSEIILTKDASVVDLVDSKGSYKAISVQYKNGDKVTNMIVPITEMSVDQNAKVGKGTAGSVYYVRDVEACEMKCTTTGNCSKCTQEITERCKSQTCRCDSPTGGCEGSITFPPE